MDRVIFDTFFSLAEVCVGPTIIATDFDGCWIGSVKIIGTRKNILIKNKIQKVGIREFNNTINEELEAALNFLSIKKTEFDYFINQYYLFEWENSNSSTKPDISAFINREYI